jgi:hypothetical protein
MPRGKIVLLLPIAERPTQIQCGEEITIRTQHGKKSDLPVARRALEHQRVVLLLGKIPACRTLVSARYCEQREIELFQVALDMLCHGLGETGRSFFSLPFLRLAQLPDGNTETHQTYQNEDLHSSCTRSVHAQLPVWVRDCRQPFPSQPLTARGSGLGRQNHHYSRLNCIKDRVKLTSDA